MTYPISSKLMLAIMVAITSTIQACKSRDATSRVQEVNSAIPERCVALRGNGTHIVAHVMDGEAVAGAEAELIDFGPACR
jgi:hypothetical protein